MSRFPTLIAVVAVSLALTAGDAGAQSISGILTDQDTGEPILGAQITLLDEAESERGRAASDRAGWWSIRIPVAGAYYSVRVERIGYARIETEPFLLGAQSVELKLATRREVVRIEGVSTKALAYEGVVERARNGPSVHTLLPEDVARRIGNVSATNTGRLVAHLIAGLEVSWTGWPLFQRLAGRGGEGTRRISCDAVVAVDGIPYFKNHPEVTLERLVPLNRVRAVEVFKDPAFLPIELGLDAKRNTLDPEINCGVVAIWTEEGIAVP